MRLGRLFPHLDSLVLANCPLRWIWIDIHSIDNGKLQFTIFLFRSISPSPSIDEESNDDQAAHEHFQWVVKKNIKHFYRFYSQIHSVFCRNLNVLNLSSANINSWTDIDRLAKFPSLRNVRVQNWPLWSLCDHTEHERRQFVIARLPHIEVLNGGGRISADEREDAERAFIRHYTRSPENERPAVFADLIARHGKLDPLVKVDLRPEKKVQVKFTFGERSEIRYVDVYRWEDG